DFSDLRQPHTSPAADDDDAGSLTTYLIISLVFVSLLFLVSTAAFVARRLCQKKQLKAGHVLSGADNLPSGLADAAAAGTLPRPYCYEISLTTGSGNSEFRFLKPFVPSLPPQPCVMGVDTAQGQQSQRLHASWLQGMQAAAYGNGSSRISLGRLVVADRLDREQLCGQADTCTLPFELLLADPLQFFRVEVTLDDINDHSPIFPEERITFKIPETTDPGSRFPLEVARDLDIGINSVQAYSIAPENEYFSVSFGSRIRGKKYVELVLEKPLDREEQAEMDFSLIAVDGGSPPRSGTTQIHITVLDVNDNAPVFTQELYDVQVLENAAEGSVVLNVLATDQDSGINGDISYQFSKEVGQTDLVFEIDPKSGEIKLRKPLDFEAAQTHELSVRATDGGGLSAICKVLVEVLDVNDNAPELLVSSFSSPLPENSAPGTVVALFTVRDRDAGANGKVSCALDHQLFFSLRPAYKNYYELVTVRALDREDTAQHILSVTAADAGSPPLTSTHTFVARRLCQRKQLKAGHVLSGADNLPSGLADAAAAGTLPRPYCYEISLTTGSGNSEFRFLKPFVPSLPPQPCVMGVDT
ncbi:protocadherin beta-13-like, partial [Empidonax traillii]|uniref:protocadherin beta-13-like n=1 Tax=Empidonax traillii TaxID=164674 RepID=UPI000FFD095C